jgi:hypothetical protein
VPSMSRAIVPLILAIVPACGRDHSSPYPTAPSLPVPQLVQQQGLSGYVSDTAFRTVGGAKVEVVDGPQAGMTFMSDAQGLFSATGTFSTGVMLRASKEGYVTQSQATRTSAPGGRPWVSFQLEVVAPPVNLAGDYTLTVVADSACTEIPNDLRTRSYSATVAAQANGFTRPGTFYTLTARGGPFVQGYNSFTIGVAGDYAAFMVYQGEDFGIVEEIVPGAFFGFYGESRLSVGTQPPSTLSIALDGAIDYCALKPGSVWNSACNSSLPIAHAICRSKNHQLILTRR